MRECEFRPCKDASARILQAARPVVLQAEVHPHDVPAFASAYRELTGKGPSVFERKTRGCTITVWFNGDETTAKNLEMFPEVGTVQRFHRGEFRFCIVEEVRKPDDAHFFWKLVRNGFNLS
jgi:hypothetical protein